MIKMIKIRIKELINERKALERVFGQALSLRDARELSGIGSAIRDLLREHHALTQQEWTKRGLEKFGSAEFKSKKYISLKAEFEQVMDDFRQNEFKCSAEPVSISRLNGLMISPFDLATLRELGIFK